MRCPKCGSKVRPSKKSPGYYLCDTCKKRYPASSVVDDRIEYEDYDDDGNYDDAPAKTASATYDYYDTPKNIKSGPRPKPAHSSGNPRHRRKKKGNPLKVILLILLLVAVIIVAAVVFGIIKSKKSGGTDTGKAASASQEDAGKKDTAEKDTYGVGETADCNDVQIQILSYEESAGNEWAVPAEGKTFVFLNLEITNNSDKEISVSSMSGFDNYCGDARLDYSSDAFTALSTDPEKQQMDGNIAGGEKLSGYLSLEVPTDWSTIEIHYADSIWSNSKIKFVITK